MKAALRALVIEVRKHMPVTSTTGVTQVSAPRNPSARYQSDLVDLPVLLEDGRLLFDARYNGDRKHETCVYLFDPTPEARWPHRVCYTAGYYQTTQVVLADRRPDDKYLQNTVSVANVCLALDREPAVHQLLASRAPHTLRADPHALAQLVGISSSTMRKWIETGGASDLTKERIREALGCDEDEIP